MPMLGSKVRGIPQLYNLLKGIIEAMQGMLWLLVLTTAVPWLRREDRETGSYGEMAALAGSIWKLDR